jgi:CBS-domain-containing membrane protein
MVTASKSPMSLCAADVMSRNMVMIPRQMSLHGAARMLSLAGVTGGPVLDDNGCCIGVLSPTDFLHSVENDREPRPRLNGKADGISQSWQIPEGNPQTCCCVEEFMTKDPVLVPPSTPIGKLAQMMVDANIHRIIVVDMATHRPLGIVSSMDILAAVARVDQTPRGTEKRQGYETPVGALS